MSRSDRTTQILDAAEALLLKQGIRGTSMEAIAARAGIAKPTLYAYFPNKDAILAELAARRTETLREACRQALQGEGDLADRVGAALITIHKLTRGMAGGSRTAIEGDEGAAGLAAFERELAELLERELAEAGIARPRLVTQVLLAASDGIGRRAQSAGEIGPGLRLLTNALLRAGQPG